jgi:hypothetical protein
MIPQVSTTWRCLFSRQPTWKMIYSWTTLTNRQSSIPIQFVASIVLPNLRVELTIQRKAEKVTTNRKQRSGMKARDIHQKYPKDKADQLIKSLRLKGLWYWDPDFENDEEDWLHQPITHISNSIPFPTESIGPNTWFSTWFPFLATLCYIQKSSNSCWDVWRRVQKSNCPHNSPSLLYIHPYPNILCTILHIYSYLYHMIIWM